MIKLPIVSDSPGKVGPAVWETARKKVQSELGWLHTRQWLGELSLRSAARGQVTLVATSLEIKAAAMEQAELLEAALTEVFGQKVKVRIKAPRRPKVKKPCPQPTADDLLLEPERVDRRNLLSGFLTGSEDAIPLKFALEAVLAPGRWHPLVFYGESGSGKTHLLQGIVNGTRRRRPGTKVVYTSAGRFCRQYALTMRKRQTGPFRELFRSAELLVIDDLQELAGRTGTERELCFTLDHLQLLGRQVVLSCATHPKRLAMDSALRGRLLGGQVVQIRPPEPQTRLEIVRARCAKGRLTLGDGVSEFLSSGVDLNARELLSAMTRLEAHQRLIGSDLQLDAVREILSDILEQNTRPANLDNLVAFVAERLLATVEQLKGRSRKPSVVQARQIAMALSRELTGLTLREVGAYYGGRSCASVHFAQARSLDLCEEDPRFRSLWGDAGRRFKRLKASPTRC